MPRSVTIEVLESDPWLKLVEMPETCTPVPICIDESPGPEEAARKVLLNVSEKLADWLLYPVVFTLAILLPMTSRPLLKVRSALTPEVRVPMSAMDLNGVRVDRG